MKKAGPRLSLIAAVAGNGVIGKDGALPWKLPADLKRFKDLTWGKPLLMGRRTYESIGKPLPGRVNIVLSRDPGFRPGGAPGLAAATAQDPVAGQAMVAKDLDEGLAATSRAAAAGGVDEVMVIGGAWVYEQTIGMADRIYLTRVAATIAGDAAFPPIDPAVWREVTREDRPADERNEYALRFLLLERRI